MYDLIKCILIILILTYHNNICGMDSFVDEKKQELNVAPYIACDLFSTERVKFDRINSAQQEIKCYEAINSESGFRNPWFIGVEPLCLIDKSSLDKETIAIKRKEYGSNPIFTTDHDLILKKDLEYFQKKEQLGFYKLPMSFADYIILDKSNNELVGRFIFKDCVKDGRIENGIYVLKKFRKNGLGIEIMAGIFKNVIDPAIGKSFVISLFFGLEEDIFQTQHFETKNYHNFQGVFGKVSPWYNYPSVAVSNKTGCALSWKDHIPTTFYPIGSESSMGQSDIDYFNKVIKTFFLINESSLKQGIAEEQNIIPPERFFSIFNHGEEDSSEDDPVKDGMIGNLYNLLHTKDYDTFISTIEALIFIGESKQDLRGELSPEEVSNLLSKNRNFLSSKHKDLLEYLSKENVSSESREELSSENSEEVISQINKKRPLAISDRIKENDIEPNKRRKQNK